MNWPELLAGALSGLAGIALARGDALRAARLLGAASCFPDPGPSIFFRLDRASDIAAAREVLGEDAYEAAFAEGETMNSDESIPFAMESLTSTRPASRRSA